MITSVANTLSNGSTVVRSGALPHATERSRARDCNRFTDTMRQRLTGEGGIHDVERHNNLAITCEGLRDGHGSQIARTGVRSTSEGQTLAPFARCMAESPRVCRRLQPLRNWSHGKSKAVLGGGAGAGGPAGRRARARV